MHILSKKSLFGELFLFVKHRSNIEVDLQSLFGLNVTWCAQLYSLAETTQLPRIWTRVTRALLVSKDRRHLFVTPCSKGTACSILSGKGKSFFFKRKDNVDRHSVRPLLNNHQLAEPTCFLNFKLPLRFLLVIMVHREPSPSNVGDVSNSRVYSWITYWVRIFKRPGINSNKFIPTPFVAFGVGTLDVQARRSGSRFLGSLKGL